MDKANIPIQFRASASSGQLWVQVKRNYGRVYNLNQDDIMTSPNMVANMITLNSHKLYALLDLGATHFFISCRFDSKINMP